MPDELINPMTTNSLICIKGGTVYDPTNGIDGEVRDIWIDGTRIVAPPGDPQKKPARTIDAEGLVIMPGGVDIHCHIAGPKVNVARKLRPEETRKSEVLERTRYPTVEQPAVFQALLPQVTSMQDWATPLRSMLQFLRSRHDMPMRNLRILPVSTKGSMSWWGIITT